MEEGVGDEVVVGVGAEGGDDPASDSCLNSYVCRFVRMSDVKKSVKIGYAHCLPTAPAFSFSKSHERDKREFYAIISIY